MAVSSAGSLSSPGLGSGLDINGLVTKLMSAEQQPLTLLDNKEAGIQTKITGLGTLTSAVSAVDTAASPLIVALNQTASEKFASYKANLADSAIGSATATSSAALGSYSLEVIQLAKSHRLTTTAGAFTSSSDTIANGTLSITLGTGSPHEIEIDDTNNTLGGLKDAINAAKIGVSASLVTVASGDVRLVLSSNTEGLDGKMTLTGLAGFQYDPDNSLTDLSQEAADGGQAAQGSEIKLNGLTITNNSNTVSGVIDGVTLTLAKETTSATTLTVSRDTTSSLTGILTNLVKAYNDYNKSVKDLGKYDEKTKAAGPLLGNATLRQVSSVLSSIIQSVPSGISGTYTRLSDLGIQVQKDGSLTLNNGKLTSAISADYDSVAKLVTGFGSALKAATSSMLNSTNGTLSAATNGLNRTIKDIANRRLSLQDHLTKVEANYRAQFNAMDSLVASMNQTSTYLQQQLSNLSKTTSSK